MLINFRISSVYDQFKVTSSSAAVGCTAQVASKSFFVAPILTATAATCISSAAPSPTMWIPRILSDFFQLAFS